MIHCAEASPDEEQTTSSRGPFTTSSQDDVAQMKDLLLLPRPRQTEERAGLHVLKKDALLLITGVETSTALFIGDTLLETIRNTTGLEWDLVRYSSVKELVRATITVDPAMNVPEQGYRLTIEPETIEIQARDPSGAFYGACTLSQIIRKCGKELPCVRIEDWPDFKTRGVMLDISRSKVPTMETLFALIDKLASWKINHIELYTEHTFAYRRHKVVWENASPMTGLEMMALDAYCTERFIDLVPNQNSFGHMERWLRHPEYAPLSEVQGGNTLCPTDEGSLTLIEGLYDELLPHFTSEYFNVGCDETQLGDGRSRAICEEKGQGRVYIEFLLKIHKLVTARGKTMLFWGDIIMRYPELVNELPKDIIALEWGYEAQDPFDEHSQTFAAAGIPFYVCPGTSSWISVAGRTENCVGNLLNAAKNGLKHGATGYLICDWGDLGHWQYLPVSYLGFAFGASLSWCVKSNEDMPLAETLSLRAFDDPTGHMGQLAHELGDAGTVTGLHIYNDSPLFSILQFHRLDDPAIVNEMKPDGLELAMTQIENAMAHLDKADMQCEDADLIRDEFLNAAALLRHACNRGDVMKQLATGKTKDDLGREIAELGESMAPIMEEHKRLWLSRNRPGGLDESLGYMQRLVEEYEK